MTIVRVIRNRGGIANSDNSALAQAARDLGVGESATFSPGLLHDMGSPAGATAENRLEWQARFHHDSARRVVHLMGKSAANEGGPTDWRHRIYDIDADSWSNVDFNFDESGHIYATFALDSNNGDCYIVPGGGGSAQRELWRRDFATGDWEMITDDVTVDNTAFTGPPSVTFHPNLFGSGDGGVITAVQTNGANFSLCYYRPSNEALSRTSLGIALGGTSSQGAYCSGFDGVIVGRTTHVLVTPNGSGNPDWTTISAPTLQTMGTNSGVNHAVMMQHPRAANLMLAYEKTGTDRMWLIDEDGTWDEIGTHLHTQSFSNPCTFCTLPEYEITWSIGWNSGALTSVIYKPPTS